MSKRTIELDLNETGFLCNMIMTAYMATKPPRDKAGNLLMPVWLSELYTKLATINDQMMDESSPKIILPKHTGKH